MHTQNLEKKKKIVKICQALSLVSQHKNHGAARKWKGGKFKAYIRKYSS